jgi:hypothetical protein
MTHTLQDETSRQSGGATVATINHKETAELVAAAQPVQAQQAREIVMAAFGIDPALLVVDQAELARLRGSAPLPDCRQAGNLERELSNKESNLQTEEARLTEASRTVVEMLGNLKSLEAAHKRLEKVGGPPATMTQKIDALRGSLKREQQLESRLTSIVTSWKADIARFLAEGPKAGPTNGELISSSREREKELRAAGL